MDSSQLQLAILEQLDQQGDIADTRNIANLPDAATSQTAIKAALDSLKVREMVEYTQHNIDWLDLSEEGQAMAQSGSHEFRVWAALDPEQPRDAKYLQAQLGKDVATAGQLNAFKRRWIAKKADGFIRAIVRCSRQSYTNVATPSNITLSSIIHINHSPSLKIQPSFNCVVWPAKTRKH
jgi:phenylalanyl-tRNA synthetase alpha chain